LMYRARSPEELNRLLIAWRDDRAGLIATLAPGHRIDPSDVQLDRVRRRESFVPASISTRPRALA
jgi:hypothetical protein